VVAGPAPLSARGCGRRITPGATQSPPECLAEGFSLVPKLTIEARESFRQPKVTPVDEEHRLLTVREVADAMRVSTMTVYRLIRSGSLGAIRVGKHFRIRTRDLEGYLEAQSTRGGDAWPAA
jgi:excisionase family DNA binding protein